MESLSSWTKARNAILRGLRKGQEEVRLHRMGLSIPAHVEAELLKEGFLTPESQETVGFVAEESGKPEDGFLVGPHGPG